MKGIFIAALLLATIVLGGLLVRQNQQASQSQASLASLQEKLASAEAERDRQTERATRLNALLEESQSQAVTKAAEPTPPPPVAAVPAPAAPAPEPAPAPTNAKPANALSAMLKTPSMKKMIQAQMGSMLEMNYGKVMTDLQLTPEQTASLKDLLMNKMMAASEIGLSMFNGDADAEQRKRVQDDFKTKNEEVDGQIKQLLGDDKYAQFQDYEKTQGERMAVNSFKEQLGDGPKALSTLQEQQLLHAMSEEKTNFKFTTDLSDKTKFEGDFASFFTEDRINQYFDEQTKLNQKYVDRAQGILSSEQLGDYQKYLTSQQEMQKAGMQMAQKMFAPKEGK